MTKRTGKWLRHMLERHGMTQQELADKCGLSLFAISKLVNGHRHGSDDTWEIIEAVFDKTMHTLHFISREGDEVTLDITGQYRGIFDMIALAKEYGYDENIIADYVLSMRGMFEELILNQEETADSDEAYVFDRHCARVLRRLGQDFIDDVETQLAYFEDWLADKTKN